MSAPGLAKHLAPKHLSARAEFEYANWYVLLDPGVTWEDLFSPVFWAHHQKKLSPRDVVRVREHEGKFDCLLQVESVPQGGIVMKRWPYFPAGSDELAAKAADAAAEMARPKVVALANDGYPVVRVDYKTATNWRVLGQNGEQISEGHSSQGEAQKFMDKYLRECGLVLPSQDVIDAKQAELAAEAQERKEARKAKSKAA